MNINSNLPPEDNRPFSSFTIEDIKGRAKEILSFLPQFLKNPVVGMRRVPSWDWPTIILLEIILSEVTGILGGIVDRHLFGVLTAVIVAPVSGLVMSVVIAGLFYYATLFFLKTELEFRKVFVVVVLAKVPAQILGILSPLAKPITLLCILITALLLIVGFVDNFMLDKKRVTRIVGSLAGLAVLFWVYSTIVEVTTNHIKVQEYTPESLDQIHKELNEGK